MLGLDPNFLLRWILLVTNSYINVRFAFFIAVTTVIFGCCVYYWCLGVPGAVAGWHMTSEQADAAPVTVQGQAPTILLQLSLAYLFLAWLFRKFIARPLQARLDYLDGVQDCGVQNRSPQAVVSAPTARPAEPPMGPKTSPLPPRTTYK